MTQVATILTRAHYVLVPAQPSDLPETRTESGQQLPDNWRTIAARDLLQALEQAWLQSGEAVVLSVPSAGLPVSPP